MSAAQSRAGTDGGFPYITKDVSNTNFVNINGNTSITVVPGQLDLHPGPSGEYSVVRFTAPVTKQQAEQAASLLGQSITDFTEAALAEKAQVVLQQQERIVLSERDFARFVELIETPPAPTPQMREAMKEYRRSQTAHPDAGL